MATAPAERPWILCTANTRELTCRSHTQAAKFGRAFLDLYDPTDFVQMGQALKVLNAVRFYEIGIPLSYAQ